MLGLKFEINNIVVLIFNVNTCNFSSRLEIPIWRDKMDSGLSKNIPKLVFLSI